MKEYTKTCLECNKSFTANRKDKIYCSVNCRVNHNRRNKSIKCYCPVCKKWYFRTRRDKDKKYFCSAKCKETARRNSVYIAYMKWYDQNKEEKNKGNIGYTLKGLEKSHISRIDKEKIDLIEKEEIDKIWKKEYNEIQNIKKDTFNPRKKKTTNNKDDPRYIIMKDFYYSEEDIENNKNYQ